MIYGFLAQVRTKFIFTWWIRNVEILSFLKKRVFWCVWAVNSVHFGNTGAKVTPSKWNCDKIYCFSSPPNFRGFKCIWRFSKKKSHRVSVCSSKFFNAVDLLNAKKIFFPPFHKFPRKLIWPQNRERWQPSSDAECKHWSTMTSYRISREFTKRRIRWPWEFAPLSN